MSNEFTADPCTFADQVRYPVAQQIQVVTRLASQGANEGEMPLIVGKLDHSHTDPVDFLEFVRKGARALLLDSGVILQCLAARTALNKIVDRPLLHWVVDRHEGQEYILGEEIEAGLAGADGICYRSGNLLGQAASEVREHIETCREHKLASTVLIEKLDDVEPIVDLLASAGIVPDMIATVDGVMVPPGTLTEVAHFHLNSVSEASQLAQAAVPGSGILIRDPAVLPTPSADDHPTVEPIVKVCGIKTVEAAARALESGANLIGMILVPNRSRTVDLREAKRISDYVHSFSRRGSLGDPLQPADTGADTIFDVNSRVLRNKTRRSPLVVGVFQNMSLENILTLQQELNLDLVQLHGDEPLEWCRVIPVPVIKRFTPGTPQFQDASTPGYHYISLIDGEKGGEGQVVDWSATEYLSAIGGRFLLAGGLHEGNVLDALRVQGVAGVDVSGGVESSAGVKDLDKISRFVAAAKSARVKL